MPEPQVGGANLLRGSSHIFKDYMLTEAAIIAMCKVAEKTLELLILCIMDQPPQERRRAWARWFKLWEPLWAALKLDVSNVNLEEK